MVDVELGAGGVYSEAICCPPVVVAVEDHVDPVGADSYGIVSRERRRDRIWMRVEHSRSDVDRFCVVQDARLRAHGGRKAGIGVSLDEIGSDARRSPGFLIEAPVELD